MNNMLHAPGTLHRYGLQCWQWRLTVLVCHALVAPPQIGFSLRRRLKAASANRGDHNDALTHIQGQYNVPATRSSDPAELFSSFTQARKGLRQVVEACLERVSCVALD
jgi:hypothetical protein